MRPLEKLSTHKSAPSGRTGILNMNDTETMLDERDLYLLGVHAEGTRARAIGMGLFPRG
jgi:hypothetical protein